MDEEIAAGLEDEHVQVRYLSAVALGVLGSSEARPALERALQQDDEVVVRSQTAIALGQINDKASIKTLRDRLRRRRRGPKGCAAGRTRRTR